MKKRFAISAALIYLFAGICGGDEPSVGPMTEKRFPPLVVPDGFQATLFACDPLVEYPSVIALGPRQGTLFVAHDYMTGLGVEIVRRDEVRLLSDSDGDGYADKSKVFAKDFNSIQGLAYYDGTVFVMHAPFLTSVKDTNGDGVADERRDLIEGLGLPPEENSNRLHCANGVVAGHDGWLYLALGDRGCDVLRPEGDRLLFQEGGILRCRRDGSDLHVFSTGLRNIYDVALDEQLNVFVRDNENDGGDFMIRVCHCFFGSDHGYPYKYVEHIDEYMPPLADLGRGSSAGVTTYLEKMFPAEYQKSLICCEWGRAIVRYPLEQLKSSFAPTKEFDFAHGAEKDEYPFKPTDVVVDWDGSLLISDWCDGQRPKRGRARIYRISYPREKEPTEDVGKPVLADWIRQLNSSSYHQRVVAQLEIEKEGRDGCETLLDFAQRKELNDHARLHMVWILANVLGTDSLNDLFRLANADTSVPVRIQAIRAIADLTDPVLTGDKLSAGPGDAKIAERLSRLRVARDSRLLLEVIIAMGRLQWKDSPRWIFYQIKSKSDPAIAHAAMRTFRQSNNWDYIFKIWDNEFSPSRPIAIRAAAEQYNTKVVDELINREGRPPEYEYAKLLARVYKKPGKYEYWGFRPGPRPVNTESWERTEAIERALSKYVGRKGSHVIVKDMVREAVPTPLDKIKTVIHEAKESQSLSPYLDALLKHPPKEIHATLGEIVSSTQTETAGRLEALTHFISTTDLLTDKTQGEKHFLSVVERLNDDQVLVKAIDELAARAKLDCDGFLIGRLDSKNAEVRASAIRTLAHRGCDDAAIKISDLLGDKDVRVRRAAALAAGKLKVFNAGKRLIEMTGDDDLATRRESLRSLVEIQNPGAVEPAIKALDDLVTQLAALGYLEEFGNAKQTSAVLKAAETTRAINVLASSARTLSSWHESKPDESLNNAIAKIHGRAGVVLRWTTFGPLTIDDANTLISQLNAPFAKPGAVDSIPRLPTNRKTMFSSGTDARIVFDGGKANVRVPVFVAVAHVDRKEESNVEWIGSSDGDMQIWLNSNSVFRREQAGKHIYQANADRFDAALPSGLSRLVVRIENSIESPRLHLRFREKSSKADHERLIKLALAGRGNVNRGREVFAAAEKSQCIKCHRIDERGGRIGPDLTGIGSRFSRIYLVESILQPSRTVAPSYGSVNIVLTDGRVLTGVKIKEDKNSLTLGDNQGKMHLIVRDDIDEMVVQPRSTMPEGLEKKLTDREFVDLLAYLLSLKK